ncbi:MAG: alanine racemase [Verrucomicrobia bacterium]|nr:alanine racemase [Verrucomicrobiota bacterium]
MHFRCWAEIDLQALRENLAWLRHRVGPGVKIITVVKADAYGHGLQDIARLLMQSGTDIFGVANLAEAEAIRSVGKGWPILMLGACLPHEVETSVRDDVMPTLSTLAEAKLFSKAAQRQHRVVRVHVKVDTGMGRLGVRPEQAVALVRQVAALPGLRVHGLFTHYSAAEDDAAFSRRQREQFVEVVASLNAAGITPELIHANNSGAVLLERGSVFNTVRPGLLVYGIVPPGKRRVPAELKRHLRPALSWKCRVSLVKGISKGAPLSYGHTFIAPRRMRVATLTAGYGDGYLRASSNRASVLIRGRRCHVLGRVTMDQMIVDVSRVAAVKPGDEAVLVGRQGRDEISATELAAWCGTIPWEVLTAITYRVRRVYRGGHAA